MQSQISERILMTRRQCAVYKIPPVATARGHCTDDWKGNKMLIGFVQVYSLGLKGGVFKILNPNLSLFAEGKFNKNWEHTVDRCYDSGRYFAVWVQNQFGQKAMVGLGFEERNDAFDFVGAFSKYKEQVEILQNPDKYLGEAKQQDFSLKAGEKISLSFGSGTQLSGAKSYKQAAGGGLKKLAPPPKAGGGLSKPPPSAASFAPSSAAPLTQNPKTPSQPLQAFQQQQPASTSLYQANWSLPSSSPSYKGSQGFVDYSSFGSSTTQYKKAPAPSAPAKKEGSGNLIDLE